MQITNENSLIAQWAKAVDLKIAKININKETRKT